MAVVVDQTNSAPKKNKMSNSALVEAVVALWLADTTIKAINPNDVKTDRLKLALALAPIVKGCL